MLNITVLQGDAHCVNISDSHSNNELEPHTQWKGQSLKCKPHQKPHTLLLEVQRTQPFLENSLEPLTSETSISSTPGHVSKINENIHPHKELPKNATDSFTYPKQTQYPARGGLDKQILIQSYKEILLSSGKE